MALIRCACWLIATLATICPIQLCSQQLTEQPTEITVCALQKEPQKWNHKLVRVSGYATHGYEESSLVDPKCNGYVEGTPIWMEYGGRVGTGTIYFGSGANTRPRAKQLTVDRVPVPLVEDANFKQLDRLLQSHPNTRDVAIVPVTVQGHFFAGVKRNGEYGRGYGHFGCCTLFVIEKVEYVAEHPLSLKEVEKFAEAFHLPPPAPPMPADRNR